METREIDCEDRRVASQKLRIIRQQETVARLFREGKPERARQARAKLFAMLNQLDLMEERSGPPEGKPSG